MTREAILFLWYIFALVILAIMVWEIAQDFRASRRPRQ